ncbi:phospholipase A2 inhibitor CNF-like [Clupea harengus]|uniref:Phospholipase A2 inhibitor CNF-like n=1 Tax=Clupea harengus TaxID=7950 RepID=A0A6P8EF18_CLUHA|nr:phospholipase A2 inhibitor CNF-like [Clupea harengus]
MRLVFTFALLLLSVSFGGALKCNFCMSRGNSCVPSVQTCPRYMDACGSVLYISPYLGITRNCMNMATCQTFMHMPNVAAICCSTDLCN